MDGNCYIFVLSLTYSHSLATLITFERWSSYSTLARAHPPKSFEEMTINTKRDEASKIAKSLNKLLSNWLLE